jgi:CBS domain-containing protein
MRPAEGDVFGFPSLMNAAPLRNQSVAIEDSLIYHLDGEIFGKLRRRNDRFDTYFIRLLSDRLLSRPATTKLHGAEGRAVSQLITRPPVTIDAAATIQEAARKMVDERVSAILVMDEGHFCGITTDRDFRQRVVARGLPPRLRSRTHDDAEQDPSPARYRRRQADRHGVAQRLHAHRDRAPSLPRQRHRQADHC